MFCESLIEPEALRAEWPEESATKGSTLEKKTSRRQPPREVYPDEGRTRRLARIGFSGKSAFGKRKFLGIQDKKSITNFLCVGLRSMYVCCIVRAGLQWACKPLNLATAFCLQLVAG